MKAPKIESIRFEELSFRFDGGTWLLNEANFDFPMNKFVKIDARDGSGKSTLLRLLAGLLEPSAGHYFINERPVTEMSFQEFLDLRLQIGYSFDMGGLLSNKTLFENIMLPLVYHKICSAEEAKERAMSIIVDFGLGDSAHQRPSSVRGSDRKAACVARALVSEPQVLLLDEPTIGLSMNVVQRFVGQLQKQMRNNLKHVFIATDDQKILSEFGVHRIEIVNQKLVHSENADGSRRSTEVA